MLGISSDLILFLLISMVVLSTIIILIGVIWGIYTARKKSAVNKKKTIWLSVLFIFIAAVSWILNFGWLRLIMTFLLVPFLHALIFFAISWFASSYTDKSKNMRLYNLWFGISYLCLYIFMPDGADYGGPYFFFGLIHNDVLSDIAEGIASLALAAHLVFLVLQIVEFVKIIKNKLTEKKNI